MTMYRTIAGTETYKGESYRLERRDILHFGRGVEKVWCWEILSGHAQGWYGGHCATKAEARRIVKESINAANEEKRA